MDACLLLLFDLVFSTKPKDWLGKLYLFCVGWDIEPSVN